MAQFKMTVHAEKKFQNVELTAVFNENDDIVMYSQWMADITKEAVERLAEGVEIGEDETKVQVSKPVKMATDKQINYLKKLGYQGDYDNLTAENASNIIDNMGGKKYGK